MKKLIGDKAFYKMVFALLIPMIIQNGISSFVNLLDNIMIGQLGTLQMSGVSITNELLNVFNITIFGAMGGPGIFLAQFYGKKDRKGIQDCFHYKIFIGCLILCITLFTFICFGNSLIQFYLSGEAGEVSETLHYASSYLKIMLLGLVPFVLSQIYNSTLRETHDTVIPMISTSIAIFTNFILNYILIFGKLGLPALGVQGAAIATVVARYLEFFLSAFLAHIRIDSHEYLKGIYHHLLIKFALVKAITIKSLPLVFNEVLWSMVMAGITQAYSTRGLNAIAAMNITRTISNTFMILCYSSGGAISIIIGQQLGANQPEKAYDYDLKLLTFMIGVCIIAGGILFGISPLIPEIYNTSSEVKALSTHLLQITGMMLPVVAAYYGSYFTLRAGGKALLTFFFDSGYATILNFPLAFILSRYTALPIIYLYLIIQLCDLPKAILGLYLVSKKIWINNLVNEY